jgi:hypothetical protein
MNRIVLVQTVLIAFLMTPANAQQSSTKQPDSMMPTSKPASSSSTSSTDLRAWSIPNVEATINKATTRTPSRSGEKICGLITGPAFIPLSRKRGEGVVAILGTYSDEPTTLNPRDWTKVNFEYGPIPELKDMTPSEADRLWNSSNTDAPTGNERSYKLVSTNGAEYFLDLLFARGHLQKYKVRGPEVGSNEDWHPVSKSASD